MFIYLRVLALPLRAAFTIDWKKPLLFDLAFFFVPFFRDDFLIIPTGILSSSYLASGSSL